MIFRLFPCLGCCELCLGYWADTTEATEHTHTNQREALGRHGEGSCLQAKERSFSGNQPCCYLGSQPPELWESKFSCSSPCSVVLCHGSPTKLLWALRPFTLGSCGWETVAWQDSMNLPSCLLRDTLSNTALPPKGNQCPSVSPPLPTLLYASLSCLDFSFFFFLSGFLNTICWLSFTWKMGQVSFGVKMHLQTPSEGIASFTFRLWIQPCVTIPPSFSAIISPSQCLQSSVPKFHTFVTGWSQDNVRWYAKKHFLCWYSCVYLNV